MLQINDYLIYGTTDVCQVVDIRKERFGGTEDKEYYVLKPVYADKNTIYAPVDNGKMKMRRILTIDEVRELINTIPDEEGVWIDNDRLRKEKFNEILKNDDRKDLANLIKTLRGKRREQMENGRKFCITDDNIMKAAEKLLYNEFALVLEIEPEEVASYILEKISLLDLEPNKKADEQSQPLNIVKLVAAAGII